MDVILEQNSKGKWGIIQDQKEVVPFVHEEPEYAVAEWQYFQRENINHRFLDYVLTEAEINTAGKEMIKKLEILRQDILEKTLRVKAEQIVMRTQHTMMLKGGQGMSEEKLERSINYWIEKLR